MTIQLDSAVLADTEFDLDLSIVPSRPVVADLVCNADDNRGSTCTAPWNGDRTDD